MLASFTSGTGVTWQVLVSIPRGVGRCWGERNTVQSSHCTRVHGRLELAQWFKGKVQVSVDLAMSFACVKLITRPHSCFRAGLDHLESCAVAQM